MANDGTAIYRNHYIWVNFITTSLFSRTLEIIVFIWEIIPFMALRFRSVKHDNLPRLYGMMWYVPGEFPSNFSGKANQEPSIMTTNPRGDPNKSCHLPLVAQNVPIALRSGLGDSVVFPGGKSSVRSSSV